MPFFKLKLILMIFTLGSSNLPHCGRMKKIMPFMAPGSVTARINSTNRMTYGNNAGKNVIVNVSIKIVVIERVRFMSILMDKMQDLINTYLRNRMLFQSFVRLLSKQIR